METGILYGQGKSSAHYRPCGSLLWRTCTCYLGDTRCCVVHVAQPVLDCVATGEKLSQFSGAEFRRILCRLLALLGHHDASHVTLKSFRAGRATSLAANGHSIGEILIAGEWKSSAFLRYCQADDLSVSAFWKVVLEDDHDDGYLGIGGVVTRVAKKKRKKRAGGGCILCVRLRVSWAQCR